MDDNITPSPKMKGPYFTILLLAIGAVVSTSVTVACFHILFIKYCKRRRQTTDDETLTIEQSSIGLERRILNTIPILFYSFKTCELYHINQGDQCVICLGSLKKGDFIRWLPVCNHVFHVPCIDNWFEAHSNCPICRSPVVSDRRGGSGDGDGRSYLSRTRSGNLMCHCNKMVVPIEGLRPTDLVKAGYKRSLSMDRSSVLVDVREHNDALSPSSSSSSDSSPPLSKIDFVLSRLYQAQSNQHLEDMRSMAPRWMHGLRSGQDSDLRNIGILPY